MAVVSTAFAKTIIANRLTDGAAVWLNAAGKWTAPTSEPYLIKDEETQKIADIIVSASLDENLIIEPVEVDLGEDLQPVVPKYQIVTKGPTVRKDLGYQAIGSSNDNSAIEEARRALLHVSV